MTEVTPADDSFHAPATDDPFWTETAWFGFSVPERRMSGAVYPLFRPNQGVCSAGVYVWDDSGQELWQLPYARNAWHAPMPDHDLRELRLLNGLEYDCVEPLTTYRVRYADADEIALDLMFEALHPPHGIGLGSGSGHLDQAGRVTGTLDLHGERITVDCVEMRDRSWGVRRDHGMVRAGYHYGFADGRNGFQAMSFLNGDEQVIVAGYLLEDGELVRLVSGTVKVVRTDTAPVEVVLDAQDARGHLVQAHGECVNRFAFQSSPNYFAWMSLTRWDLDGTPGWGQNQDVWSPDLLRAARRGTVKERGERGERGERE